MKKDYKPNPIDTTDIVLDDDMIALTEILAKNVHEVWALHRIQEGWTYGQERNDQLKKHPCLVPYEALPEVEKQYDRNTLLESVKVLKKLGYTIHKK